MVEKNFFSDCEINKKVSAAVVCSVKYSFWDFMMNGHSQYNKFNRRILATSLANYFLLRTTDLVGRMV